MLRFPQRLTTVSSLTSHVSLGQHCVRPACSGLGAHLWLVTGAQSQHWSSDFNPLNCMFWRCWFCFPATNNSGRMTRHSRNGGKASAGLVSPPSPAGAHGLGAGRSWAPCRPLTYFTERRTKAKREAKPELTRKAGLDVRLQMPSGNRRSAAIGTRQEPAGPCSADCTL